MLGPGYNRERLAAGFDKLFNVDENRQPAPAVFVLINSPCIGTALLASNKRSVGKK